MNSQTKPEFLLEMLDIRKSFSKNEVLKGIDFNVKPGEVIAITGTNGAGKSTLMNILGGVFPMDSGEIRIKGEHVDILNPVDADNLRIGFVHQEPNHCNNMTVYENIFLNRELKTRFGTLDRLKMIEESKRVILSLGFEIDVNQKVEDVSLVSKVVISIAKAMLMDPEILILDEVTATLNYMEVQHLFDVIRELRSHGLGIIFITHKIREVVALCDRCFVIRDGTCAGIFDNLAEKLDAGKIINLMLGEATWSSEYSEHVVVPASDEEKVRVENISHAGIFSGISFNAYKNEILGFAGLKGSGITEIMYCLFGIMQYDEGDVFIDGKRISPSSPKDGVKHGICMITNDRQKEGLALGLSIGQNILIASLDDLSNNAGFIDSRKANEDAQEYAEKLDVVMTGLRQQVQFLSGGNQQKVVVAKWLLKNAEVLLIDEPTRGIDVRTKTEIYKLLLNEKDNGDKAILIYSPETQELLNICNRILVVREGEIIAEVVRGSESFNEQGILNIVNAV